MQLRNMDAERAANHNAWVKSVAMMDVVVNVENALLERLAIKESA